MPTLPLPGFPSIHNHAIAKHSLETLVRDHIRDALADILQEEVTSFLARMTGKTLPDGRPAIVRNGFHRTRTVQTAIGPVDATVPRTIDRSGDGTKGRETFRSAVIPRYARRSATFNEAVCYFYLKGLSTNDMLPSLQTLFGPSVTALSPTVVSRLTQKWSAQFAAWNRRDLADTEYTYVWADGIHFNVRTDDHKACTLVVMGATRDGRKEPIAIEAGYRESHESWALLLRSLRARGLRPPKLFIADGAMGFWSAAAEVYPETRSQRCWVHKTANLLDKLPKSAQPKAKLLIKEMYTAETKANALAARDRFTTIYGDKYPKAVACLHDSASELFAFYDFPAAHWQHLRTTNPIESTFATVRKRTYSTRGQGTLTNTVALAWKLIMEASRTWRRLKGSELIVKLYDSSILFVDGLETAA